VLVFSVRLKQRDNLRMCQMKKLLGVTAIIMGGLILAPTFASAAGVARPQATKAQVSKKPLIVLAAHASRECRDDDGTGHNCAR
jgi:hypothetical protein